MVRLQIPVCLHILSLWASAHPASPLSSAFSLLNNAESNTTVPLNLTSAQKSVYLLDPTAHKEPINLRIIAYTTASALPQDPFHYDTGTPLSIVLYSYGKALNATRVNRLITHANDDAFGNDQDSPILTDKIIYYDILDPPSRSSYITLGIRPIERLTWGQWEVATRALIMFFTTWDVVELQFEVEWAEGLTKIGWGRLVEIP